MKNVVWLITLIVAVIFGSSLAAVTNYGDLATWVAAAGTVGTLVFLATQHMQQMNHNLERFDFERQQWLTQAENSHFDNFDKHLQEIVEAENFEITFQFKRKLHKSLFTDCISKEFKPTIEPHNLQTGFPLFEVEHHIHDYQKTIIEHSEVSPDILNIDYGISSAFKSLHVTCFRLYGVGDISNTTDPSFKPVTLNILQPVSSLFLIVRVSSRLHEYCKLEKVQIPNRTTFFSEKGFIDALFDYCYSDEKPSYIHLNTGPLDVLTVLYKTNQVIKSIDVKNCTLNELADKCSYYQFFNAGKCYVGDPNNQSDVKKYLQHISHLFNQLVVSQGLSLDHLEIINGHRDYLSNHFSIHEID